MLINMYMKCHEDILNGFQVTERTRFCDGQTDGRSAGWTDDRGKNNMSPNPDAGGRGDIIIKTLSKTVRNESPTSTNIIGFI